VLGLVTLDLLGIFADIIINLYQCDGGETNPKWNDVREGLGIAGLVFSCLFLSELTLNVWVFGLRFVRLLFLAAFIFVNSGFCGGLGGREQSLLQAIVMSNTFFPAQSSVLFFFD